MTHFDGLTEGDYFGGEHAHALSAVGWLTDDTAFPTGVIGASCFKKLKELLVYHGSRWLFAANTIENFDNSIRNTATQIWSSQMAH